MNPITIIIAAIVFSVFLTALASGLKATLREAFFLFGQPALLLRSLFAMNVVMPLVAVLLALYTDLIPIVKVALVAISVSPLPPFFPKKPMQAGGDQAYVTSLLFTASLLSIILIPLTLEVLQRINDKPIHISIKSVIISTMVTVIVPLFIGIGIRYLSVSFAEKVTGPLSKSSAILLVIAILPLLYVLFPQIRDLVGNGTLLAITAFIVTGLFAGYLLGGPHKGGRTVLAFATAARHPGIAIALAGANFPDKKQAAAAIVLYLLVNAIISLPFLRWLRPAKGTDAVASEVERPVLLKTRK